MHQNDQPQPARRRHEHLGRGRGNQAIDQRDSAVREPRDDAVQRRECPRVRLRPTSGNAVLGYLPAERAQPVADPPVVSVTAARPLRIVDTVGHDEMDSGHNDRS